MSIEFFEQRVRIDGATALLPAHERFFFPAGEAHINFTPTATVQIADLRGADGNDLFALAMWADACKRFESLKTVLLLPYLPGARQDRGSLDARVYANFINDLDLDRVVCVDPHSDVMPALIDRLDVVDIVELMAWKTLRGKWVGVISPDIGARKRAEKVAGLLDVPVYQAMKHRDFATGKLSNFTCEEIPATVTGKLLVVDDICDGGGTFIGLADALNLLPKQLDLWVTHGVFSNGAVERLLDHYGQVFCTDSHPGSSASGASVSPIQKFLIHHGTKGL